MPQLIKRGRQQQKSFRRSAPVDFWLGSLTEALAVDHPTKVLDAKLEAKNLEVYGGFPIVMRLPPNGWLKKWKMSFKMDDDWGYPPFMETPIWIKPRDY